MANWLTKILPPVNSTKPNPARPVATVGTAKPPTPRTYPVAEPIKLPNASIIYGIAASILFVLSLLYFFTGIWLTAFLLFLPAICFFGFALHFLKNPNA